VPPGFRLVDIITENLVQASPVPFSYVCLSSVWGPQKQSHLVATSKNVGELEEPGSLICKRVPETVQDAMVACHHLGQRYLWVDRLYNLQDDDGSHGHKQAQLNIMVEIYKHASVTLVAATGTDVNFVLSGMSKSLGKTPKAMQLGFPVSLRSIWETCGWTHQEAVLSRQLILFTEYDTFVEDEEGELY
ncbi:uncharacterized protein IWZ02DRAFT_386811, partial [Phyllosticta citriasiana]|uniref:uncharacterized protein n=1 Tax=Phyllosticta citriasiana TaxID=595635 RepID=UPI0030FDA3C1